jgi:hypothetical protein
VAIKNMVVKRIIPALLPGIEPVSNTLSLFTALLQKVGKNAINLAVSPFVHM